MSSWSIQDLVNLASCCRRATNDLANPLRKNTGLVSSCPTLYRRHGTWWYPYHCHQQCEWWRWSSPPGFSLLLSIHGTYWRWRAALSLSLLNITRASSGTNSKVVNILATFLFCSHSPSWRRGSYRTPSPCSTWDYSCRVWWDLWLDDSSWRVSPGVVLHCSPRASRW